MDGPSAFSPTGSSEPFAIESSRIPRRPLVVASPHSGSNYPDEFVASARLDRLSLRRSEDCFVDALFAAAPDSGAPLLKALFPRAYVDANREPYELDPAMFEDPLPAWVNLSSPRVAAGLGTVPRVVADGTAIYRGKLKFDEVAARIDRLYRPYHAALEALVAETEALFGFCVLLDAHSMPSWIGRSEGAARRAVERGVDIVLGDRIGRSCDPLITRTAERVLQSLGYRVALNAPFAGGFTTGHYGQPARGRHCLQIEINRALYMSESTLQRSQGFDRVQRDMAALVSALAALPDAHFAPAQKKGAAP